MIGIFIIATGQPYADYAKSLIEDIKKYFLTGREKQIFVFTDSKAPIGGAITVYQKHNPWPYSTLCRYDIFMNYFNKRNHKFENIFYLDADMSIVDYVGDEILGKLVATIHPGYYKKNKEQFSLETKFLSMAYVNPRAVNHYFAGGFNGGSDYFKMAHQIISWRIIDAKYGYIPEYHDETYLNRYCAENEPDIILTPQYCMPDAHKDKKAYGLLDMSPKIIAITKKNIK
jgi:histo-blood group ABO system transferase